jgi:hypothetical protein
MRKLKWERGEDKYGIIRQPYITHKGDFWGCTTCRTTKDIVRAMVLPPVCPICGKYMTGISVLKARGS